MEVAQVGGAQHRWAGHSVARLGNLAWRSSSLGAAVEAAGFSE